MAMDPELCKLELGSGAPSPRDDIDSCHRFEFAMRMHMDTDSMAIAACDINAKCSSIKDLSVVGRSSRLKHKTASL